MKRDQGKSMVCLSLLLTAGVVLKTPERTNSDKIKVHLGENRKPLVRTLKLTANYHYWQLLNETDTG